MAEGVTRNQVGIPGDTTIRETPGVCGGYPCIGYMRFPVRVAVLAYRELGSVERVVEVYPQLTAGQVRSALDFYASQPARVDEDIETNDRALKEIMSRPWPA